MTREKAIKIFRKDIECLSHSKCTDCILEKVCDPMMTPTDSEYLEAFEMAIKALENEPCEELDFVQHHKEVSVNLEVCKMNYCDRNICIQNEYNGIGCDECEVTKSQEPKTGHCFSYGDIKIPCL